MLINNFMGRYGILVGLFCDFDFVYFFVVIFSNVVMFVKFNCMGFFVGWWLLGFMMICCGIFFD